MELTDEQIEEYRRLYRKRFGRDISRDEARAEGMKLVQLIKTVYVTINRQRQQDKKTLNKVAIP